MYFDERDMYISNIRYAIGTLMHGNVEIVQDLLKEYGISSCRYDRSIPTSYKVTVKGVEFSESTDSADVMCELAKLFKEAIDRYNKVLQLQQEKAQKEDTEIKLAVLKSVKDNQ